MSVGAYKRVDDDDQNAGKLQVYETAVLFYFVMQSDGNIFVGDVVLESVSMASRGEDIIIDQLHVKQISYEDFEF